MPFFASPLPPGAQILKPHVLNYWNSFAPGIGLEEKHFLVSASSCRYSKL